MTAPRRGEGFDADGPPERSAYDWDYIAGQCLKSPGEWYLVFTQDRHSIATSLRAGNAAAIRPVVNANQGRHHGFEVRTGNTIMASGDQPRLCSLWLRYLPESGKNKRK